MRAAKITEKLALTASVLALSCSSDHRVSPWGGGAAPPLFAYVEAPDLGAQLRAIDRETAELGLTLRLELHGALPHGGGEVVVRAYAGADAVGRPTSAVRVATPRGVVMAVGPLDSADEDRDRATELVPSLLPGVVPAGPGGAGDEGGVFASGSDLNGDGDPDVVLRNEAGALEIWAVRSVGTTRYGVSLEVPPTLALDVDDDGRVDLGGRVAVAEGDAIAPDFLDVATFEEGRYTDRSSAAQAFHAARAAALGRPAPGDAPARGGEPGGAEGGEGTKRGRAPAGAPAEAAKPSAAPTPLDDRTRLRRALERAWHARLAGQPKSSVLSELDQEPVPAPLRAAFALHRERIARAGPAERPAPSGRAPAGR